RPVAGRAGLRGGRPGARAAAHVPGLARPARRADRRTRPAPRGADPAIPARRRRDRRRGDPPTGHARRGRSDRRGGRMKLLGGVTLGVAARASSVGLLLAAAWLIVRAAQQPPVLYLMVAIVAVRFFGISRSVFRYGERLVTHDVALAEAVERRVTTYVELDRVAPAGLGDLRRGDVVSRVVGDVATLQDRLLRVRIPWWTGLATVGLVAAVVGGIDPVSALVMLAGAASCAVGLRTVVARIGSERRDRAEAQGRLSAEATSAVVAAREL